MRPFFFFPLLATALLAGPAEATFGFDLAGTIDLDTETANFWTAGLQSVGSYLFPCRTKSASQQIDDWLAAIAANNIKLTSLWLDIETDPSTGCGYSTNLTVNCQFMRELSEALDNNGVKYWGVYSTIGEWSQLFGNNCEDPVWSTRPLWYANPDNRTSFADFRAFGGWSAPFAKQYLWTDNPCGVNVDSDWLPGPFLLPGQKEGEDMFGKPL